MRTKEFEVNKLICSNRSVFDESELLEDHLDKDPFQAFENWLAEAMEKDQHFANAMTLSTTGNDNMPDSRIVLLRDVSYGGFTFYTNYQSKKAKDIEENSKACLLFFWKEQMRQVKIRGEIRFLPARESEIYFAQRPFANQVGAWASQQSKTVASRAALDEAYAKELKKYENKKVPRPEHWGGYVLLPSSFEFWQGRMDRLHDRIRYRWRTRSQDWLIERLMP